MLGDGFDIPASAGTFDRIIVTAAMEQIPETLLAAARARRHPDRAGRPASRHPDPGPGDQDRRRIRSQGAGRRPLRAGAAGHRPRTVKPRIGCPANVLFAGLSGCLLATCLLKTVICCVRVSNHVPCRRVALLASRAARRGAGADVVRLCRLQRRHADAPFAEFLLQSLCLAAGSHRLGAGARGRAPRAAAIFPPAIAVPVAGPAAADRRAADPIRRPAAACPEEGAGSPPMRRRPVRSRPPAPLPPRSVAAARAPAPGGTTIIVGTSDTLEILARRYNVSPAAILQANGYKGPRALSPGQQLIIPRSRPPPLRRRAVPLWPRRRASRLPRPRAPPAFTSSIAATRCSASRVAIIYRSPNSRGPTISIRRRSSSSARS